jgi:dephospho-CoA kinase
MSTPTKALVGLTGGIASGKSTVARMLAELGVAVVDADALAREVVQRGSAGLADVVATFGAGVLTPDGDLDREKLGAIVFGDATARAKLNAITHPRIAQLSAERILKHMQGDTPYVVYEAALLVETGAYKGMQAVVVVAADAKTQALRGSARDGVSEASVQARIASQLPLADKLAVADYVIYNDGDLEALRARTLEVHAALVTRFGAQTGRGT